MPQLTSKGNRRRFLRGHRRVRSLEERFWEKVNKVPGEDACWVWTAHVNDDGYGGIFTNRRNERAHRAAWFLETGKWPEKQVLHHCDNRLCVRFQHLFEGTHLDNIADMNRKGRRAPTFGEKNPRVKISDTQVSEIRQKYREGAKQTHLGREYGIASSHVSNIVAGRCRMGSLKDF